MNIAYLSSLYARASDSFIRAEVLELRSFGHTVHTFSIMKPESSELVSDEIRAEHAGTDYILKHGILVLSAACLAEFIRNPFRWLSTLALAVRCGWPGLKGRLWPLAYFVEACYLARRLRKNKTEHLHCHIAEGCAATAMLASSLSRVPYSMTVHGPGEFDRPTLLSLAEKVRCSKFTVTISQYGRSQLFRWTDPIDWKKIQVVRCGVLFDKEALPPPGPERRLVCVGRLNEQKGHLVLVEAAALLKSEAPFEVVFAGDGPLRGAIEKKAAELGVSDRIKILGWMSGQKVREEILRSRAMVLPSFAEGLPVVLMESLALERPVIATAIAGIPELVENGVSGWLVPASSVERLAEAMREALRMEPSNLAAMGRAGSLKAREMHDRVREARKLEGLMQGRNKN